MTVRARSFQYARMSRTTNQGVVSPQKKTQTDVLTYVMNLIAPCLPLADTRKPVAEGVYSVPQQSENTR